jgi:hypothetical protein
MIDHTNIPFASISLFDLMRQGGWAMFPLGLLSFTLFTLILLSWLQTTKGQFGIGLKKPKAGSLYSQISQKKLSQTDEIWTELDKHDASISSWIQYLNVIATVAPMVGLLGTVSGMIGAFQTIASGGMGKPERLAGDIGEALITTATGLTIGIPAMIFFFVLRNRLDSNLQLLAEKLENLSTEQETLEEQSDSTDTERLSEDSRHE